MIFITGREKSSNIFEQPAEKSGVKSRAVFRLLFPVFCNRCVIVKTLDDNFIVMIAITSFQTFFSKIDRGEDEYFRIQHSLCPKVYK